MLESVKTSMMQAFILNRTLEYNDSCYSVKLPSKNIFMDKPNNFVIAENK